MRVNVCVSAYVILRFLHAHTLTFLFSSTQLRSLLQQYDLYYRYGYCCNISFCLVIETKAISVTVCVFSVRVLGCTFVHTHFTLCVLCVCQVFLQKTLPHTRAKQCLRAFMCFKRRIKVYFSRFVLLDLILDLFHAPSSPMCLHTLSVHEKPRLIAAGLIPRYYVKYKKDTAIIRALAKVPLSLLLTVC